jgi:hypothetical protein
VLKELFVEVWGVNGGQNLCQAVLQYIGVDIKAKRAESQLNDPALLLVSVVMSPKRLFLRHKGSRVNKQYGHGFT